MRRRRPVAAAGGLLWIGSALMVVNASSMDVGNAGHAKQYE
jgi:hypothetical protein